MSTTIVDPKITLPMTESGMRITDVRIRNFRSLQSVQVKLDKLTVLIGENNAGKTSFLDALYSAIGVSRRVLTVDDVYIAPREKSPPKDRRVIIDVLLHPVDDNGNIVRSFPAGSFWLKHWGNAIMQDDGDQDFVAIRTELKWDSGKREYVVCRWYLAEWPEKIEEMGNAKINTQVGTPGIAAIEPLAMYYMDARRDMYEDMQNRSSFWNKLVSDLGLPEETIAQLEAQLSKLNKQIVDGSAVLEHIQYHLDSLYQTMTCDQGSACISPMARHLRDINKGIEVSFATKGAQSFPLARHGMGTRSLASILTFRAYTTWRQQVSDNAGVHPVLALEEPEAHLHPQAQRALFHQIEQIPGQRIVSTHSPYIASQAPISLFRYFRKEGPNTTITAMDTTGLAPEELHKIDWMVMATRGDILYARALVFYEGITEEHALTEFARAFFGFHPNDVGITMAWVGGAGNYLPFLRMANSFGIPWYVFSDGEADPVSKLYAAVKQVGVDDPALSRNIVIIPNGLSFEQYIVRKGYKDAICSMLDAYHGTDKYLDKYIADNHNQKGKKGIPRDYQSRGGRERAMVDCLCNGKTVYGRPLATTITGLVDPKRRFPLEVRSLLKQIASDFSITRKGDA